MPAGDDLGGERGSETRDMFGKPWCDGGGMDAVTDRVSHAAKLLVGALERLGSHSGIVSA